jgi:hypothetical protein
MYRIKTITIILSLMLIQPVHAIEVVDMNEQQAETLFKPLEVKKGAIPWSVFSETKEISKERTLADGSYTFDISPQYSPNIKKLHGKQVTLMGYMFPLEEGEEQQNFLLGPFPLTCPFHYHASPARIVEIVAKEPIPFSYDPVVLKGRFDATFNKDTQVFYYLRDAVLGE